MLYHLYELNQAALTPARAAADAYRLLFRNPLNPAAYTPLGRSAAVFRRLREQLGHQVFERGRHGCVDFPGPPGREERPRAAHEPP